MEREFHTRFFIDCVVKIEVHTSHNEVSSLGRKFTLGCINASFGWKYTFYTLYFESLEWKFSAQKMKFHHGKSSLH